MCIRDSAITFLIFNILWEYRCFLSSHIRRLFSTGKKRGILIFKLGVYPFLDFKCPPLCSGTGCGSQQLLRIRSYLAGRCPNNFSLFPPLAAVVVVAYSAEILFFYFAFVAACGTCRGKAPPSADADRSPLKSPTGAFIATQTRGTPNAFSPKGPTHKTRFSIAILGYGLSHEKSAPEKPAGFSGAQI